MDENTRRIGVGCDRSPEAGLAILKEAGGHGTLGRVTGTVVPVLLGAGREDSMLVVGSRGHGRVAEEPGSPSRLVKPGAERLAGPHDTQVMDPNAAWVALTKPSR